MNDPTAAEAEARDAAEAWLRFIDEGDASRSWEQASSTFRGAVTESKWASSLGTVRERLGRPLHRTLDTATFTTELPGAPDGNYVVLTYRTEFERKKHGTETVVPELDGDTWRVSGYFVK